MSVGRCTVRRGFFHLRPCDQPAVAFCAQCNQPACAEHLTTVGGVTRCVECQARSGELDQQRLWQSRSAAYGYRNRYYTTYRPSYWSTHHHYTDHDYQQFDSGPADPDHDYDDPGSSFSDS